MAMNPKSRISPATWTSPSRSGARRLAAAQDFDDDEQEPAAIEGRQWQEVQQRQVEREQDGQLGQA